MAKGISRTQAYCCSLWHDMQKGKITIAQMTDKIKTYTKLQGIQMNLFENKEDTNGQNSKG